MVILPRAQLDAGHVAQPDDAGRLRQRAALAVRAALAGRACRGHLAALPALALTSLGVRAPAGRLHLRVSLTAGLEDDGAELLRFDQSAQGVDGELKLLAHGYGLLADLSGGDL